MLRGSRKMRMIGVYLRMTGNGKGTIWENARHLHLALPLTGESIGQQLRSALSPRFFFHPIDFHV
jgi:hypothetical protein